jgi:sterol desaturase/sphingolipid hydroxylase (fatty acid hydroxylase superfamily)
MAAIEWITLAILPAFLGLDLIRRSRRFDAPRWWRLRATVVSVLTLGLSIGVALFWASVFDGVALLEGAKLGVAGGAVVGILIYELLHYWYHRAAHRVPLLWRAAHQMHHSAESVDAFGAYYLHPVDTFLFTTWSSLVFFPLLGLDALAGAMAALFVTFNAVFQHANIRTPHWLGYLIQRPEMHGVHHAREVHQHNYSDLPLWDMVFGTYKNPATWEGKAGFYDGASSRIGAMLIGKDVTAPPTNAARARQAVARQLPASPPANEAQALDLAA